VLANPTSRADYSRHVALNRDLERYYSDCISSSTAKRFTTKRRKGYCSAVSWKRVHIAGRYNDYFKKNPIESNYGVLALVLGGLAAVLGIAYAVNVNSTPASPERSL
jgi:hypothetical protein